MEITETEKLSRILPVSTRKESSDKEFSIILRGTGVVLIPLLLFPESPEYIFHLLNIIFLN